MPQKKIAAALQELTGLLEQTVQNQAAEVGGFAGELVTVFTRGGRLWIFGSGAFGPVANLVANRFLHRLSMERPPLPAQSLCHDATLAATLARDGLSHELFSRQLRGVAAEGDVVLALGTVQRDDGLEQGLQQARQLGCITAALVQGKRPLAGTPPDHLFSLPTESPARAAEGALFFGHLLCSLVEKDLFGI